MEKKGVYEDAFFESGCRESLGIAYSFYREIDGVATLSLSLTRVGSRCASNS